ncbi:MAG: SH3 domain-containing protein [Rhodospirillaceae bacterium]|nr:SH3 domain-containing protein [Rhodospirillaceae bacterium]
MGISIFAAVVAGLAALMLWSGAEAAEAEIRSFSFECETPDGRVVKPLHGDVEGVTYTDLPAQRAQCLGTIDRKIALCWENIRFASEAENQEFADCLPSFRDQARACVGHFSFERSKCGTEDPLPVEDAAREEEDEPALETTLEGRHRVKPVDRLMSAREAANVRTGPSPDYDIVGTVMPGDELHVTGEVRGRDWLRVEYPRSGDEAYIYGPLLRLVRQLPRATERVPSPTENEASTPPEAAAPTPSAPEASDSPQPSGPSWSIAENQPCEVWNYGNRDYEPLTWTGPCMNGKASGSGRLVFRGGEGVYDGAMQGGKMHGRGVLDWANGFRYEGELRDGRQHGQGTLTQASGARYVGGWREGRPHGQGTYTQADGSSFEGAWRDGCFGEREGRWASIGTTAAACGFE